LGEEILFTSYGDALFVGEVLDYVDANGIPDTVANSRALDLLRSRGLNPNAMLINKGCL
jgi:hypothetical protein